MSSPFVNSVNGRDEIAIEGISEIGWGVAGKANQGSGVVGTSQTWVGVYGESASYHGVEGVSTSDGQPGVAGVGKGKAGMGVYGLGEQGPGMVGVSKTWHGVYGETVSTTGGAGVMGEHKANGNGVVGKSDGGVGLFGEGRIAGYFKGDVEVTGDIRLIAGNDCAEHFEAIAIVEPGTVMVLSDDGRLLPSHRPYDKRVAGVIAGAGNYKPGLILGKHDPNTTTLPVSLLGRVFCKVDAQSSPIEVGDLLTTSSTAGHAMKADDPLQAFGAVIGKALRPLKGGMGLIPVLIALQ